jgi:hypothetical protein
MAFQPESTTYATGVYQIETSDPVLGGVGGITNSPLLQLASRTAYLKQQMDSVQNALGGLAAINSQTFTGTPRAPTPATGDNSTKLATTAFVQAVYGQTAFAPLNSAALTGAPTTTTPQQGDYTARIPDTYWVKNEKARGSKMTLSSGLLVPSGVETVVTFAGPTYETEPGADATWGFYCPAGVSIVRLTAQVMFGSNASGSRGIRILRNGGTEGDGLGSCRVPAADGANGTILNIAGGIYPANPGDYFQLLASQNSGSGIILTPNNTWFCMEIIR